MTRLLWDQTTEHRYEAGLDRGVLYLADRSGVAWNGLTSIAESVGDRILTPVYHNGVKYADTQVVGQYAGSMTAFTFPDEFMEYDGSVEFMDGVTFKNQLLRRFHLSYRTLLGNDVVGTEAGYRIHILFNLMAVPSDVTMTTLNDAPEPTEFSWDLTSVPESIPGYLPVSHIVIDSRHMAEDLIRDLEDKLYGDAFTAPQLPTVADLADYLATWAGLIITDNGDGTWTATGAGSYFASVAGGEFELVDVNATYSDADTYDISSGSAD